MGSRGPHPRPKKRIGGSPRFRAELGLALAMGVPPSRMWDEFTEEDIELLVALRAYEADIDPQTGMLLSEELNPGADPTEYGTPFRFVPEPPVTNWGLKTKLDRIDELRKEHGDNFNMNGVIIPIRRVDF